MKHTKHSKAMTIANRLVKQGEKRAAAMVKAWLLVKLTQIETRVKGVTFNRRQKALEHLKRYNTEDITISLQRNNNHYDNNAVEVIASVRGKGSYCMGYLPKNLAKLIAPLLDNKKPVQSEYRGVRVCQKCLPYGLAIEVSV